MAVKQRRITNCVHSQKAAEWVRWQKLFARDNNTHKKWQHSLNLIHWMACHSLTHVSEPLPSNLESSCFGIPHTRNIVSSLFASVLLRLKWWFCILHFKQNLHEFFNENNHFRFTSMNVAIIYWLRFVRKRWKINWKQFESVTCFQLECNQESQRKQSVVCDFWNRLAEVNAAERN